tara:strand:+ start:391 stop:1047 length:657 start_codon:yes stop_codon:yes gene_type:complete
LHKSHKPYSFLWLFIIIACANFYCTKNNTLKFQNGDLLFQDLDSSPLCDAIEKVTNSIDDLNFSHVGIITLINKKEYVLEAFVNGVDTIPLKQFLKRSLNQDNEPKVIVGRLKEEFSSYIPKAIENGFELIGKEYDEEFKINNDKFYCSELIYEIFLNSNNNSLFELQPMTYKHDDKIIDIWVEYFNKLGIPVPESEPGINPGGISLSNKINIIHKFY